MASITADDTPPRPASMVLVQSLIGSGHGLSHFYQLALPPLFPLIQPELGVSYAALGFLLTLFAGTTGAFQVVAGFLVDRLGARNLLVGGLLLSAVGVGAIGLVDTYWAMAASIVVAGIGNSVFHPADYVILNASVPPSRLGRAFSIHTFTGNVGFAAAPPTMIFLTALLGWRAALLIAAALALAVVGFVLTFGHVLHERGARQKAAAERPAGAKTGWRLLLSPPMAAMFAFFTVTALASAGMQSFLVTALVATHGIELGAANIVLTGLLVAAAAGVLVGGQIADRTRRHGPVVSAALIAAAALALLAGVAALPTVILFVVFVAIGLLQGSTRPSRDIMVRQITPERDVGKVFAFVSTGLNVGGAIAPFAFGLILDYGDPSWIFWALAAFFVLGIATLGTSRMYAKPVAAGVAADWLSANPRPPSAPAHAPPPRR